VSAAALEGTLGVFLPAEVLQLLALAGASGRLELARDAERAEIWLEHGRPVSARTSGGAVRLGEALTHRGSLTREALDRALAEQSRRPETPIGSLLIEHRAVERAELDAALRDVWRRVVLGLLLWREGTFRFVPGATPPGDDTRLDLDLDRLILEALRQADHAAR